MLRGTCDPSLDGMRYFEMCFVCLEVEEMSGAISLAVHVIWSCDISPTLPINSAPSLFNSQGKGIIHHSSIYIYVQTGLDVRYLNCTCRNQKKDSTPGALIQSPLFQVSPQYGSKQLARRSLPSERSTHLSTSTTPKPTDDLFPLPEHKSFPLLTFNRRQSSTFFHTRTFCHQRKCRLTVFLHIITLPPNSVKCSVRYS
jgi:hypothetical protein